jgi:hypothetical protein
VWLTYNGEVYDFAEINRDLELLGYLFRGRGDADVIARMARPGATRSRSDAGHVVTKNRKSILGVVLEILFRLFYCLCRRYWLGYFLTASRFDRTQAPALTLENPAVCRWND